MNKKADNGLSRRKFLGWSALGLTGLTILPSWTINGIKIAPSDRVVLGFIGAGRQALSDFAGIRECSRSAGSSLLRCGYHEANQV
jgi:hypothetical protein